MDIPSNYILKPKYFQNPDVVFLARNLIGKVLCSYINNKYCAVIITETEAYAGVNDKASHAYGNRITKRTQTMYLDGGHAYIYLIYGMHYLFNIVTNEKEIPHAVLIRGGYPIEIQACSKIKNRETISWPLLNGPGKLSKIMGITKDFDAIKLLPLKRGNSIWVEDWNISSSIQDKIVVSKRIGIDYAEEDANLPYRFLISPKSKEANKILEKIGKPINYRHPFASGNNIDDNNLLYCK